MAQLGGAEPAVELALLAGRPLGVLASLASFMPGGSVSCCRWWRLSGSARRGPDGFGSVVDGVRSGGPSLMELRPPEVLGSRRPPGRRFRAGANGLTTPRPSIARPFRRGRTTPRRRPSRAVVFSPRAAGRLGRCVVFRGSGSGPPLRCGPLRVRAFAAFVDFVIVSVVSRSLLEFPEMAAAAAGRASRRGCVTARRTRGRPARRGSSAFRRAANHTPTVLRQERHDAVLRCRARGGPQCLDPAGDAVLHEPHGPRPHWRTVTKHPVAILGLGRVRGSAGRWRERWRALGGPGRDDGRRQAAGTRRAFLRSARRGGRRAAVASTAGPPRVTRLRVRRRRMFRPEGRYRVPYQKVYRIRTPTPREASTLGK